MSQCGYQWKVRNASPLPSPLRFPCAPTLLQEVVLLPAAKHSWVRRWYVVPTGPINRRLHIPVLILLSAVINSPRPQFLYRPCDSTSNLLELPHSVSILTFLQFDYQSLPFQAISQPLAMETQFQLQGLSFDRTNSLQPNIDNDGDRSQHPSSMSRDTLHPSSNSQQDRDSLQSVDNHSPLSSLRRTLEHQQRLSSQSHTTLCPQQDQYLFQSGPSTCSSSRAQTPVGPGSSDRVHFLAPHGAQGYPFESRGYSSRSQPPSSIGTPRDSIDLEKDKHHEHWDKHTKLPGKKDANQPHLPYSQRIKHFTWANYTLTMATGGLATLIAIQPHAFSGLITIGAIFYVLNLVFFTAISATMIMRFVKFKGTFKQSIAHEREGLFLGPFFLSIATIITGTQKYIVAALDEDGANRARAVTVMAVAFWIYTVSTFLLAVFQYSFLFCHHTYKLTSFMPSWLLPIFPVMLSGTIASVIAESQPMHSRLPIIVAGLGCQGLGFTVAILMYAHYIGRLMQVGYPDREHRGAMYIAVGPPSFTCLALIGMANALPDEWEVFADDFPVSQVLRVMALVVSLFLWILAMWFFAIALLAVSHHPMPFFRKSTQSPLLQSTPQHHATARHSTPLHSPCHTQQTFFSQKE